MLARDYAIGHRLRKGDPMKPRLVDLPADKRALALSVHKPTPVQRHAPEPVSESPGLLGVLSALGIAAVCVGFVILTWMAINGELDGLGEWMGM